MPFHVFVNLDSNGQKTVTVQGLEPTDTVGTLVQKLADKEGLERENVTLVFRAKQLSDPNKQLKAVGIKARSNLFVAFKVKGGAVAVANEFPPEGVSVQTSGTGSNDADAGDGNAMRRFNQTEAKTLGIRVTSENCIVNASEGCEVKSVSKLKFKECHHVYCADCVYYYLNSSINSNGKVAMTCSDTGCGAKFDIDATFVAAALTDSETAKFEKQLNKNFLTVTCPNGKCKAYLMMNGVGTNKVQCTKCKGKWFCKICKVDWPENAGSEYNICGNPDCTSAATIFEALANCERKDFSGYGVVEKNVPTLRVCIKCRRFVDWKDRCKHSTCPCGYKFCFVCLKEGHGCSLGTACQVKEQTAIY